ncbi:Glycosyl transferase family 2 [Loktanella fryxellensis]|uniref:Glycosyl transferase family 2 n=1 Tax=Loktanella fryxellensis TaxID=245187 RepID=A0A1H8GU15_9RHOB|nr:glycosyltransferase [Loktanella fryxellensis]SEN47503.1 Glycosyl transferase family 2 [Loktanella fryxellensis]
MPDLSVIVPIYDVKAYLPACLSSIAAALPDTITAEVVCIDDGSRDGSGLIAADVARQDGRFRVIAQPNGGYGKAINTGLHAARGRYVTIVESDDLIVSGVYRTLLDLLDRDPGLDFVKTAYQPFTDAGPLPVMAVPADKQSAADLMALSRDVLRHRTFAGDTAIFQAPAIWAGVYRKAALDRYRIVLPETPGAGYQDTCFSAMCFLNGMTYHWVSDTYYMYRVDRDAASRHVRNRRSEIVTLFGHVRDNLDANGGLCDCTATYFYAVYFRRLIWFMQRVRPDHRFALFIDAYRAFEGAWRDPGLRGAVQALLPGQEAVQFDQFWQGRAGALYAA